MSKGLRHEFAANVLTDLTYSVDMLAGVSTGDLYLTALVTSLYGVSRLVVSGIFYLQGQRDLLVLQPPEFDTLLLLKEHFTTASRRYKGLHDATLAACPPRLSVCHTNTRRPVPLDQDSYTRPETVFMTIEGTSNGRNNFRMAELSSSTASDPRARDVIRSTWFRQHYEFVLEYHSLLGDNEQLYETMALKSRLTLDPRAMQH